MPLRNRLLIRMSFLPSVPTFPRTLWSCGRRKSFPGRATGISLTHTSLHPQVCQATHALSHLLILVLQGPSELEIRKHLTLEEEKERISSTTVHSGDDSTETKYLLCGLDLEEQLYVSPWWYIVFVALIAW